MRGHALAALAAVLLAQAGVTPRIGPTTPGGPTLDRLERAVTRPLPTLPPPTGQHPSDVWVPDRYIPMLDQPNPAHVPAHWERRLSDREHYVPPLTATTPDGRTINFPAGVMPPPAQRQGP